ncbi:MAG: S8 family peptidase, partial [Burkholderiales bacterium]
MWLRSAVEADGSAGVIAEFVTTSADAQANAERKRRRLAFDDAGIVRMRAAGYRAVKDRVLKAAGVATSDRLNDYPALPLMHVRVGDGAVLARLLAHAELAALHPNERKYLTLDSVSANMVGQAATQSLGLTGAGVTIAVIDSGADYTHPDLGSCSAPGVPAACKVAYWANLADSGSVLDSSPNRHGTNVSAIVAGVAPGARIAALNVFGSSSSTTDSTILAAINWAISNQAAYNIRAINLSLGNGISNTTPCSFGNPYTSAINSARNAGILTVASSGNEGFTSGLANPACTPNAVSVGAVYSQDWGSVSAAVCTDATTTADKVPCFSNSASFLTMLAPGAFITAGGAQMGGTSQGAAFVSGAIAVARAAYPSDTLAQTVSRLTSQAVLVTDPRNGITKPRLQLYSAVRPVNDDFANRLALSGVSGSSSGTSTYGTKEASEPNHAGNSGGRSVWWKWVAPSAGQVSLNTHGSGFDTLLAVYTGTSVAALTAVASNNHDGTANGASGLLYQAQVGAEYQIAVDGDGGASGALALAWALNASASANLSASLTAAPNPAVVGAVLTYTVNM